MNDFVRAAEHAPYIVCLVLEDGPMIGMLLGELLTEAGIEVLGPVERSDDALEVLKSSHPTVAIVDTWLADSSSHAVAAQLNARQIPFVVYSYF